LSGNVALALGKHQQAYRAFLAGLQTAANIQATAVTLEIAAGLAALLAETGQGEKAVEILWLVVAHPATNAEASQRATNLLEKATASPRPVIALPEAAILKKWEALLAEWLTLPAITFPGK
jgi:hypothetical protein